MSFGQRFIETLRVIKYPDVDSLHPASFDWMVENKESAEFLESFCACVTEENVITEEELKEYEELMANPKVDFNVLEKLEELRKQGISEEEMREQMQDMKVDMENTERYIKELEFQKNLMDVHKLEMLQDEEAIEAFEKENQKEARKLEDEILPSAVAELKAAVDSGLKSIEQLHDIFKEQPESRKGVAPNAMFLQNLNPYLNTEEEIFEIVQKYIFDDISEIMKKAASQKSDEILEAFIPETPLEESHKKSIAEAVRLKKLLVDCDEKYVDNMLKEKKIESEIKFLKKLKENGGLSAYNLPEEQLNARLEKVQKTIRDQQDVQKRLRQQISKAINKKYQAEVDKITYLCSKEKNEYYEAYLKELEKPIEVLLDQKRRLELMALVLTIEEKQMGNTLESVKSFKHKLKEQHAEIEDAKRIIEERKKEKPAKAKYVEEGSELHVINKILSSESDPELVYLTEDDVYEKMKKQNENKQKLAGESEELLNEVLDWISVAENNKKKLEDYFYGKQSTDPKHPANVLEEMKCKLTKIGMGIKDLEEELFKEMNQFQRKKRIIETKSNIAKSRKLFVYAANDKEKYLECIKEIKQLEEMASKP